MLAVPVAFVRADDAATAPPPAVTVNVTVASATPFPNSSFTDTDAGVASTEPTVAVWASPDAFTMLAGARGARDRHEAHSRQAADGRSRLLHAGSLAEHPRSRALAPTCRWSRQRALNVPPPLATWNVTPIPAIGAPDLFLTTTPIRVVSAAPTTPRSVSVADAVTDAGTMSLTATFRRRRTPGERSSRWRIREEPACQSLARRVPVLFTKCHAVVVD